MFPITFTFIYKLIFQHYQNTINYFLRKNNKNNFIEIPLLNKKWFTLQK